MPQLMAELKWYGVFTKPGCQSREWEGKGGTEDRPRTRLGARLRTITTAEAKTQGKLLM